MARSHVLAAFFIIVFCSPGIIFVPVDSNCAKHAIQQIRSDPDLIRLLQGPKGDQGLRDDPGLKGDKGDKGDSGLRAAATSTAITHFDMSNSGWIASSRL